MKIRIARHIRSFEPMIQFYTEVLNLEVLGKFDEHETYSGIFIGKEDENWHLEFTISNDAPVHTFDEDDMLVFYPETNNEYDKIHGRIIEKSIELLEAKNPYWKRNALVIKDPEGYWIAVVNPSTTLV